MAMNLQRKKKTRNRSSVDLFHGGAAGLRPGDLLIPGLEIPGLAHVYRGLSARSMLEYAPEWVYVTSDRDLARDYAAAQVPKVAGAEYVRDRESP